jgi:hypothetical protein
MTRRDNKKETLIQVQGDSKKGIPKRVRDGSKKLRVGNKFRVMK